MPKGRMKLPEDLSGLLTDQWGTIIRQAGYNWEDAEIIRLCFIAKIPQVDAAEEIGISRRAINRRIPGIIDRAKCVAEKLDIR